MFPTFAKQSRKRCYRERKADKVTEGESERDREREREKKRETEIYLYIYIHMYTSIERERDSKRQPPFDPSVGSPCHLCITTTHHNSIVSCVFKSALRSAKKIKLPRDGKPRTTNKTKGRQEQREEKHHS